MNKPDPRSILLPLSVATGLSLFGDSTLYTVLPTHTEDAGITLAMVGILLSANRWVRLPINGPAGYFFERLPRKPIFVLAMLLGAISTGLYAVDNGFPLLLTARLLWGLSWVGIWIGGNIIILDISHNNNRGKWLGLYRVAFFVGAGGGAAIGGLLTDLFGFHGAMTINAVLTLIGALIALIFLKESRNSNEIVHSENETKPIERTNRAEIFSAIGLLASKRLVQEGFLLAMLALFIQKSYGETIAFGAFSIGSSTLTGFGLGMMTLISATSAPVSGVLSDRTQNRWAVAGFSMIPGALGMILLLTGWPTAIIFGLAGVAISSGSSANLSTAIIGDLGISGQHGRRLGGLFTIGDLASAIGPPLAIWLQPKTGFQGIFILAAAVFGFMALLSFFWAFHNHRHKFSHPA